MLEGLGMVGDQISICSGLMILINCSVQYVAA